MAKMIKVLSAGLLFCALSGNEEALAQERAQAPTDFLDMSVSVSCKDGDATFTVTNKGESWPAVGNLSVYWTGDPKVIHSRRLRLNAMQRVTFRVAGVAGNHAEFGLWVDPSWFKRDFTYDAKIKCS